MNSIVTRITNTQFGGLVAWGSLSYAFGFVTVMLHTASLGFPVFELISAVYIWIGLPLTVVAFFSSQILDYFISQSKTLSQEVRTSWDTFAGKIDPKNLDLLSIFLGFFEISLPFLRFFRSYLENLLKRAIEHDLQSSEKAAKFLHRFATILNSVSALWRFFRLINNGLAVGLIVFLYVWFVYPIIPQSFGGGAPTTIMLIVNKEKIAPEFYKVMGLHIKKESKVKSVLTVELLLLYSASDKYYIESKEGLRFSINKSVVEGIVWDTDGINKIEGLSGSS